MAELPRIKTERLFLRPFMLADANDVQRLAGDRDIASTTASIPHPYDDALRLSRVLTQMVCQAWYSSEGAMFPSLSQR